LRQFIFLNSLLLNEDK